jgi:hypothetical protein
MRHTPRPIVDLAVAVPELATLARATVRLHPRQGTCARDHSKLGGEILWPADEPWPHCEEHDCAYVSALQLRREDVPELGFREGADLFQVLWCPNDHEPSYVPHSRVFWQARADIRDALSAMPASGNHEEHYVPIPCVLDPERVTEFPSIRTLSKALSSTIKASPTLKQAGDADPDWTHGDAAVLYQYWLSVAPGTKVNGYPSWIQDPDPPPCSCGKPMEYLLTLDSGECNGGSWGRWLPQEDRHLWAGNDPDERLRAIQPTEMLLGDGGNIHYFICRSCESWPVSTVFQCS